MPGCCHVQKPPNWLVQAGGKDRVSRREEREREGQRDKERDEEIARADSGETEATTKKQEGLRERVPQRDVA